MRAYFGIFRYALVMKLYKGSHSVYKTQYHIVWSTRFQRKILVPGVEAYLRTKLVEITRYYPDWHYVEIGIDKDHFHLHMIIPPRHAISIYLKSPQ
ncbi:MAG: transposase [Candidatus Moranbacteria bacterium]|nr:transposase [Candidatus Moranbacteria bacterium]